MEHSYQEDQLVDSHNEISGHPMKHIKRNAEKTRAIRKNGHRGQFIAGICPRN